MCIRDRPVAMPRPLPDPNAQGQYKGFPGGTVTGDTGFSGPGLDLYEPMNLHSDPEALVGRFRDRWTDWCTHYPLCLHSYFCWQCLLGQIFEKLIGPQGQCCVVAAIVICVAFIPYVGYFAALIIGPCFMCQIVPVFVRRYQIPPHEQPNGCTQCICMCCVLAQMARHMEDYERHPEKGVFCKCCEPTLDQPTPNYLWKTALTGSLLSQPGISDSDATYVPMAGAVVDGSGTSLV
eukprot:TRINITY_DN49616_c0_g1_i2.p1 TRINITY_DN49616_c0_g1~~TRINITY_DN49616_c0_g1_i2.p1  ORF type:complete len:235 (+),score=25.45 TRINITY_DN49616_c0_g1_i2:28-732(+)